MIVWLDPDNDDDPFPPLSEAQTDPNGLLAAGGSLSPKRLLSAYRQGIFPWFDDSQPILWWSPAPRMVLKPSELHVSKSLAKLIRKGTYTCSFDKDFANVIMECAKDRADQDGTWITESMRAAYQTLHQLGHAHSVEVWLDDELVGGLYGIAIGQFYFGESMFSRRPNTSKIGLAYLTEKLQQWGYQYIDCQVKTEHLESLGANELPRERFSELLETYCPQQPALGAWLMGESPGVEASR